MDGERQEAVYHRMIDQEVHHNSTPLGGKRHAQRFRIEFLLESEALWPGLSYSQPVNIYICNQLENGLLMTPYRRKGKDMFDCLVRSCTVNTQDMSEFLYSWCIFEALQPYITLLFILHHNHCFD